MELPPNVYGIETEYTILVCHPNNVVFESVGVCHSEDARIGLYEEPSSNGVSCIDEDDFMEAIESLGVYANDSGMLSNGARFYIDPSGPEYSTSESATAEGAVVRSYDGDEFVFRLFRRMQEREKITSFQINRRCVDHNRASRGIHLNHSTALPLTPDYEGTSALITGHIAKGAMFGSGGLLINDEGVTEFHHSPRLSITDSVSSNSWTDRPLLRLPLKEDVEVNRVETLPTDALNFAWPMRANLIFTNTLLRIMELGFADDIPKTLFPVQSAAEVGKNGADAKMVVVTKSGKEREVGPHALMRDIVDFAFKLDDKYQYLDEESRQVLGEIIETADLIDSDDQDELMLRVESYARRRHFERKMNQRGVDLDSETLCRVDYEWDKIGGGTASILRSEKGIGWHGFSKIPERSRIMKRLTAYPEDTRAMIRARLIAESRGKNDSEWECLDVEGSIIGVSPLYRDIEDLHRLAQEEKKAAEGEGAVV